MTNNWTDWLGIYEISDYQGPAVYKVRLVDSSGDCCRLERLLKPDKEGIMCIGQTGNMEQRRKQFLTAISRCNGHSEMNLVYYLNLYSKFSDKFKNTRFQYSFCQCSSSDESKSCESDLIKLYFKEFGEVPPLNSAIPNRYEGWES
jgi:hypothetical protein